MSSEGKDTLWARFVTGQVASGVRQLFSEPTVGIKACSISMLAGLEAVGIQPTRIAPIADGGFDITFAERGGRTVIVTLANDNEGVAVLTLTESLLAPRYVKVVSIEAKRAVTNFLDRKLSTHSDRVSSGLLSRDEPKYWVDHTGKSWRTLCAIGRIKYRSPGAHALRAFVFRRDGSKCLSCGRTELANLVCDHIISRRNGGSHHPGNLQTLCDSCNSRKAGLVDARMVADVQ